MSLVKVYEYVRDLAEKKFGTKELTPLQLLYGYATVASMNDFTLAVYFSDESEKNAIDEIRQIFDKNKMDLALIKAAIPIMDDQGSDNTTYEMTRDVENSVSSSSSAISVAVLEKIMDLPITVLPLLQKGHDLQDVFSGLACAGSSDITRSTPSEGNVPNPFSDITKAEAPSEPKEENDPFKALIAADKREEGEKVEAEEKPEGPVDQSDFSAMFRKSKKDEPADQASGKDYLAQLIDKCAQLSEYLNEKMPGQREAVHLFVQDYFRCRVSALENEDRTVGGVMLFAGPPEAEQERIVYLASKFLESNVIQPSSSDETFKALYECPDCFILVDEIEAADPKMFVFFNHVISEGISVVNRSDNREINFKRAIIIFTTNAGADLYEDRSRRFSSLPPNSILPALQDVFEKKYTHEGIWQIPESIIRNLMGSFNSQNIILFNYPGIQSSLGAIKRGITVCEAEMTEKYDFTLSADEDLISLLLYSCNDVEKWDQLVTASRHVLENEIYEAGRHLGNAAEKLQSIKNINIRIDTEGCDEQTGALFIDDEEYSILYLGDENDIKDITMPDKVKIICAGDVESVMQKAIEGDVRFVLLDVAFGPLGEQNYLSIDDRKSIGMSAFEQLTKKLPCVPVYIAEKENLAKHDEDVLVERGARDFIVIQDSVQAADKLLHIGKLLYLQRKSDELKAHRTTLKYNTSQIISESGEEVQISFYDFRVVKSETSSGKYMINDAERPKEKFADVIGAEDAKKELQFFINYMKNPKPFMMNATQPPKGILLYGPPGTGKTMLARAMAAESEASFFAATGAGFADKWVGESEKNIRRLFATARKCAPSIIFIDEIDSIGKQRNGSDTHGEKELNTLIAEMDGFSQDPTRPVFVIAATNAGIDDESSNNGSVLDAALTRRFARSIKVDLPNKDERSRFLRMELGKLKSCTFTEEGINSLADRTPGMSLALIKNVIDTAGRKAAMDQTPMDDDALMNALDEYKFGEEKKWDAETAWSTAIHESGHTYINILSGEKPSFVTIVSRGSFGGYMSFGDDEDKFGNNREDYIWKIRTALAGRCAEMEFFGEEKGTNTGFSGDLQSATQNALRMICLLGMDESRLFSLNPQTVLNSPMASDVMDQVSKLLHDEMEITKQLVKEGREKIEALATYLRDNNQATLEKILECFGDIKPVR